jgi:hypothetical protein
MKAPRIDAAVRELAELSALAALGCGLATAQGDLWFDDYRGGTALTVRPEAPTPGSAIRALFGTFVL